MSFVEPKSITHSGRAMFAQTQVPFLIGVAYVIVIVGLERPALLAAPTSVMGFAVALAATALGAFLPGKRVPPISMIVVAVLDITAVALIRAEIAQVFAAATLLAIFPMLWAAYTLGWAGITLIVLGSIAMLVFRFAYSGVVPTTLAEWANVTSLPIVILGLTVVTFLAARRSERRDRLLDAAHGAQLNALAEARDAEALVSGILDTVAAGVAFFDEHGRLELANAAANEIAAAAGVRLDEPPHTSDSVLAADRQTLVPPEEQFLPRALRGEAIRGHLAWIGPPDAQMAILVSSTQLRRSDGSVQGTVVVAHDVTELADAIEVREQFLRTVSHELRTPLTGVTGFLSLIDDAVGHHDAKLRSYMDVVNRRADDLLQRLSDLVAATARDDELRLSEVDVREVVDAAVRRVKALAQARVIPVDVRGARSVRARVDVRKVEDAIAELLTNAVKFGDPDFAVTVTCDADEERVRVSVANDGPGLSHPEQRRVFDRFYRTARARSLAVQGFGLGLSRVRTIVHAHDGRIHLESAPGARTTVTIELPAASALPARQG
ncbi:ATP-binding protein [Microbacterium sp. 20-116]